MRNTCVVIILLVTQGRPQGHDENPTSGAQGSMDEVVGSLVIDLIGQGSPASSLHQEGLQKTPLGKSGGTARTISLKPVFASADLENVTLGISGQAAAPTRTVGLRPLPPLAASSSISLSWLLRPHHKKNVDSSLHGITHGHRLDRRASLGRCTQAGVMASTDKFNTELGRKAARVVFLGTPEVAATSLTRIVEKSKDPTNIVPFDVVGVVTNPPKRKRRGGKEEPSAVGKVAFELGIPTLCPEKAKDPDFLDELETTMKPDLCITAAYGQYLPKRFLRAPKYGTLNIHPSLLPRWRGASPVQRALEAGDSTNGVTVLFTVSKMDAGPLVKQVVTPIRNDAQATEVLPYLFDVGTEALLEALPEVLAGNVTMETAAPQDEGKVLAASMIDKEEAVLQVWKDSATVCHNKVRGFSIWPGTKLDVRVIDADQHEEEVVTLKIIKTRVPKIAGPRVPTDVVEIGTRKKDGLMLVCGDGSVLELLEVQPPYKNRMPSRSYWNGLRGKTLRWVNMLEVLSEIGSNRRTFKISEKVQTGVAMKDKAVVKPTLAPSPSLWGRPWGALTSPRWKRSFGQQEAGFAPVTVEPPANILSTLWARYLARLDKSPIVTKSVTSSCIGACGDMIAQTMIPLILGQHVVFDALRLARFSFMNSLIGIILHFWYTTLFWILPKPGFHWAVIRMIPDQLAFAPLCNYFFLTCFDSLTELRFHLPTLAAWIAVTKANYCLWPVASILNFWMTPPKFQVLFANIVALIWTSILSFLAHAHPSR